MSLPNIPLKRLPQLILKSRELSAALRDFRSLLGQPNTTATACESLANIVRYYPLPSAGKPTTPAKEPLVPKAPKAPTQKAKAAADPKIQRFKTIRERVAAGRQAVLNGDRPKLIDAITQVMGDDTISSPAILDRLEKRNWAPVAVNPCAYISYTLADNPKRFARVSRGLYKVGVSDPKPTGQPLHRHLHPKALEQVLLAAALKNRDIIGNLPVFLRNRVNAKDSRSRVVQVILRELQPLHPKRMLQFQQNLAKHLKW